MADREGEGTAPGSQRRSYHARNTDPVDARIGSGLFALRQLQRQAGMEYPEARRGPEEFPALNRSSPARRPDEDGEAEEFSGTEGTSPTTPQRGDQSWQGNSDDGGEGSQGAEDLHGQGHEGVDESEGQEEEEHASEDEDDASFDEEEDDDERQLLLHPLQLVELLLLVYATHNITVKGMEDIVRLFNRVLYTVRMGGANTWSQSLPSFVSMRRKSQQHSPPVMIDYEYLDRNTGQVESAEKQGSIPLKYIADKEAYQFHYSFAYVALCDILQFHKMQHPQEEHEVIVATDCVPVNKSSGESFDVVSLQFPPCSRVYPYRVFHGVKGVKMDQFRNISYVMHELMALGLRVKHIICDLPKRAALMGMKQHGAYYSCGECLVPGEYSAAAGTMFYPITRAWPRRTSEGMQSIADRNDFKDLIKEADRHRDTLEGVKARTPLFDLVDFDVVEQIPTDSMHCIFLGVVRKLMHRTFQTGETMRGQLEPRMNLKKFNHLFVRRKVPSEQTRKTRDFTAFWKAAEYRCLLLLHFPTILQVLIGHPSTKRKILLDVWASLAFVVLYTHGEAEGVLEQLAREAMRVFKETYTDYFGDSSVNLNVHLFGHILDTFARHGNLNGVSAIRSESLYQVFLSCFYAGTRNVATQGISKVYLKYQLEHKCQRNLILRSEETCRTQDNFVFVKDYVMYRIVGIRENFLVCHQILGRDFLYHCENGTRLPFSKLGIFRGPFKELPRKLNVEKKQVKGKVMMSTNYCVCVSKANLFAGYY